MVDKKQTTKKKQPKKEEWEKGNYDVPQPEENLKVVLDNGKNTIVKVKEKHYFVEISITDGMGILVPISNRGRTFEMI